MTMVTCPCCEGSGRISRKAGYAKGNGLTVMQAKLYAVVSACPNGLATAAVIDRLYADRLDGGPDAASHCIAVFAHHANKKLAKIGERIVASRGRGAIYRLRRMR